MHKQHTRALATLCTAITCATLSKDTGAITANRNKASNFQCKNPKLRDINWGMSNEGTTPGKSPLRSLPDASGALPWQVQAQLSPNPQFVGRSLLHLLQSSNPTNSCTLAICDLQCAAEDASVLEHTAPNHGPVIDYSSLDIKRMRRGAEQSTG